MGLVVVVVALCTGGSGGKTDSSLPRELGEKNWGLAIRLIQEKSLRVFCICQVSLTVHLHGSWLRDQER